MFTTKIKFYFVSLLRKNQTMIKELRIGNYVDIYYVSDLTGAEKRICKNAIVDTIDSKFIKHNGSSYAYKENIKPIALTEDWLLKLGFEKDYDQPFDDFIYSKKVREGNTDKEIEAITIHISSNMEFYNGIYSQVVKYVHQLQNLFFALTGEELKLKQN